MPAPATIIRATRKALEHPALSIRFRFDGTVRRGLWDEADALPDDATGYEQTQRLRSLVVMTEDGPYPDFSELTTLDDRVVYQIRKAMKMEDGVMTRLILAAT